MNIEWLYDTDESGESPLTRVSRSGRMEVLNFMFIQTMEDRLREIAQLSELHRAAYWGYADAIEELVEQGADVEEQDAQLETPLHKAVRLGNVDAARKLIELGANADAQNGMGLTPLHWAVLTGNGEIVDLLLFAGANPHLREWVSGGMTPLQFAKAMRNKEIIDMIQYCPAAR